MLTELRPRLAAAALLLAASVLPAAGQARDSAALVTVLGSDTVALERWVRASPRVTELLERPAGALALTARSRSGFGAAKPAPGDLPSPPGDSPPPPSETYPPTATTAIVAAAASAGANSQDRAFEACGDRPPIS